MKVLQKTLVAAGLATAVFATGAAQAATTTFPSTATTPAYSTYIPNNVASTTVTLPNIEINMGTTEALSVDDSIDLTLSAGTFKVAVVAANLESAGAGTYAVASGGTVGSNTVKFRVTGAAAVADTMTIKNILVDASSVADNGAISLQVDMKGFVGGESTALFGTPLTALAIAKLPVYSLTIDSTTSGVFEVATGFKALTSTTGTTSATTGISTSSDTAETTVALGAAWGGTLTGQTTTGVPAAEPITGDILYTISGNMTGVSSIACTNCTGSSSAGVASTAATAANALVIDADNSAAYGVAGALDNDFTWSFAGDTVQSPVSYSITVSTTADAVGGYNASTIGSGTIASFIRNGSSFATNSFGSKNKLTITDHSGVTGAGGADGAITLTAYDADGAAVTCTGLTIPNVEANATVTIQGADVLAACPGAKRIDGIVNSTTINVTNVKITSDGATMQSGNNAGVIAQ